MKKKSNLFAVILLGSLFLLSGCDQGQKKEATEANVKKDIYLQLYSVRDDIKAILGTGRIHRHFLLEVARGHHVVAHLHGHGDGAGHGLDTIGIDFAQLLDPVENAVQFARQGGQLVFPDCNPRKPRDVPDRVLIDRHKPAFVVVRGRRPEWPVRLMLHDPVNGMPFSGIAGTITKPPAQPQ